MATSIFFKVVLLVVGLSLCSCDQVELNTNFSKFETVTKSQVHIMNSTTSNSSLSTIPPIPVKEFTQVNDVVQHSDPNAVNTLSTVSSDQSYNLYVVFFLSVIIVIIVLGIVFLKQQGNYQVRDIFRNHETPV